MARHPAIEKMKAILVLANQGGYRPSQMAAIYEKHNARCLELGLYRPSERQACAYRGGYPV